MTQSFCEPARRRSVGDETAEIGADFAAHIDTLERAHAAAARMIGRIDAITLMPNRLQFIDDLSERPAKGAPPPATLVMLTLADAKPYNRLLRVLGHSYAEDFIRAGAERLQSLLGPHVLVYHVSLLSFAFLVDGDPSRVEAIAADVASGFDAALDCRSLPVNTTVGIGLTALPEALTDPAEPLRAALAAVQDSRKQAMRWAWYNRHSDAATVRAFRLLTDLSAALEQPDELELVFQPRLALESGVRASAEALIRWRHKELGPVSPAEFVGLAEATALITPLTRWVVKAALRQFAQWSEPARPQKLSINISPKNTTEPDFIAFMAQACDEAGVAPHRIELEFTEGVLAADIAQTVERLSALKALGFEIAIDDFGSGYSNMRYLMDLPAQILKIDQTFIRALPDQPKSATLVRGMIELGHALGFRVVAEGVETAQILDQLRGWGCDEVQGYHLARPMPSDAFADWLRQNPTA